MKIGYIGLGALGSNLARRFLQDHELRVWDINPAAVTTFRQLGAGAAATAADLGRECDAVVTCLPRSSDVHQVLFGPGGVAEGLSPGKLVIDQTSGVPARTREMADRLRPAGVMLLDASVSASPALALQGGATLMVGAPDDVFERALPVLHAISKTVHRCGTRVGDGQAMKMVNNAMNGGNRLGILEIVALARAMGLSLPAIKAVLEAGSGANQIVERLLPALLEGRASTDFALSLMIKDLNQAVQLGMEFGAPMPISATVGGLMQIGLNTLGKAARLEDLIGMMESWSGVRLAAGEPVAAFVPGSAGATLGYVGPDGPVSRRLGLPAGAEADEAAVVMLGFGSRGAERGEALSRLVAGQVVVDLVPGDPARVRSLAAALAPRGVKVLDAAIVSLRQDGAAMLACGGEAEAWAPILPALASTGLTIVPCGTTGAGHAAALANTAAQALSTALMFEVVAAGLKYGLRLEHMCRVLSITSAWSNPLRRILPALSESRRTDGYAGGLEGTVVELREACQAGMAAGAPTVILDVVRGAHEAALHDADGRVDGALARSYERTAGVRLANEAEVAR